MTTPASILLTGAGSGIGLSVLEQLLEKQPCPRIQVLTLAETPELTALEQQHGKSVLNCVYGDATEPSVLQKAVDETINNYGAMTHLIHCIGTMLPVATIRNVPMTEFRRVFDINFFSTVDLLQRCLPHLSGPSVGDSGQRQSKPKVIIVSSGADFEVQYRGWSGYCTSKAALTRLIHLLAHEEPEIDVFGVLPQVTKSPMTDKIVNGDYDQVMSSEERARFTRWLSEGRFEPARYIGGAIVKAAMGDMSPDSAEIERNVCGALFIGSLYQKSDSFGQG